MVWFNPKYLLRRLTGLAVQRPFALTAAFLIGSSIVLIASAFGSASFGRQIGETTTERLGTEFSSAEADFIAHSYSSFLAIVVLGEVPERLKLDDILGDPVTGLTIDRLLQHELAELEGLVSDGELQHIGVIGLDQTSLFSLGTELHVNINEVAFQQALQGTTASFMNRGVSIDGPVNLASPVDQADPANSDGRHVTVDLIESYIPFSVDADDIPEAVLHVSKNVTGILAVNQAATADTVRRTAVTRIAALLGLLSAFVFILDLTIMKISRAAVAAERSNAQKLDMQNAELQRLDRAKNEFLGNLSHELKTPLASILGFTRIVKSNKKGRLGETEIKQLEIVDRNGMRLDSLINDLLDLSRVQSGRIKLIRQETELCGLLHSSVDGFQTILGEKQQSISLNIEHADAWVDIDPMRVAQVISNLISNASKYSADGSVMTVKSSIDGDDWVVSVEDHGHGIDEEHYEQLFTLFYRTPEAQASATQGTGIGLFISKQIIDMHCGQIGLQSKVGKGTTVTVRLPGIRTAPMDATGEPVNFSNAFNELDQAV